MAEENTPEEQEQEAPEEESEESGETAGGSLLSPIVLVMFLMAGVIDLIGLFILFFGLDDFGILDFTGLLLIGPLMFIHSGSIGGTKGAQELKKKIFKRLGISALVEMTPIVGSLSPSWTIAVFFHVKNS